jgi:hypothetical protein
MYANSTPISTSEKTVLAHLEIDKVNTGASLSTGTSPTTESTTLLNLRIKSRKMRAPVPNQRLKSRWADSMTRNLTNWARLSSHMDKMSLHRQVGSHPYHASDPLSERRQTMKPNESSATNQMTRLAPLSSASATKTWNQMSQRCGKWLIYKHIWWSVYILGGYYVPSLRFRTRSTRRGTVLRDCLSHFIIKYSNDVC